MTNIRVLKEGKNNCEEHDWVYEINGLVLCCYPPISVNKRICKHCGRVEEVSTRAEVDLNEFNRIYDQFYNDNENI